MADNARTLTVKYESDTKGLEKGTKRAEKTTGGFGKTIGKVGTIAAGAFTGTALLSGVQQVGDFLTDATKAAMEDQKSQALLAKTMQNVTHATKPQIEATEGLIDKLQRATGVADDELRPAFSTLLRGTKNVAKAQQALKLAMDVSAGSGKPLALVAQGMSRAFLGNSGALGKLGIQVKQTVPDLKAIAKAQEKQRDAMKDYAEAVKEHGAGSDQAKKAAEKLAKATEGVKEAQTKTKKSAVGVNDVMKQLNQTFGGQAAKAADTTEGKMKRLQVQWSEMKENIGYKVLPVLATLMDYLLNKLPQAIGVLIDWISTNWPKIQSYIQPIISLVIQLFHNFMLIVNGVWNVLKGFVDLIAGVFTGDWSRAWKGIQEIFTGVWRVILGVFKNLWDYLMMVLKMGLKALAALWSVFWSWFSGYLSDRWEQIKHAVGNAIGSVIGFITGLPARLGGAVLALARAGAELGGALARGILGALTGLGRTLAGLIRGAINALIDTWNAIDIGIHIKSYGIGKLRTPGLDINDLVPDIPRLATGGITTGAGMAWLHPAEVIAPLNGRGGGLGNVYNITVNVPPTANVADAGRVMVDAIRSYERTNGNGWRT